MGIVTPIAISRHSLHLVISSTYSISWILSIVYNAQSIGDQNLLWKQVSGIATLQLPWLVTGDFNYILSQVDHRVGNFDYYARKAEAFNRFISSNALFDCFIFGLMSTWCNGQRGLSHRWARLDRCLANMD